LIGLLANLLMLQGLHASTLSWNYPAWSISLEFIAYQVFPFVLMYIWRAGAKSQAALAAGLLAALLATLHEKGPDLWVLVLFAAPLMAAVSNRSRIGAWLAVLAMMVGASLLLATACYRWIEKPAQRYLRKVLAMPDERDGKAKSPPAKVACTPEISLPPAGLCFNSATRSSVHDEIDTDCASN